MGQLQGLILAGLLLFVPLGNSLESGCNDWTYEEKVEEVCCLECKPGNHLMKKCGPDPEELCSPCDSGKFVSGSLQWSCNRCSSCTGVLRVKKNCTSISNTVCECIDGFQCSDEGCSSCVQVCSKGQQPKNRVCEPCPSGTFNDKIHHSCVNWTKCPYNIISPGSAESDVICGQQPDRAVVIIVHAIFGLICFPIILYLILLLHWRRKSWHKEKKDRIPAEEMPHAEENSFCFPQQEHSSGEDRNSVSLQSSLILLEPRALQA